MSRYAFTHSLAYWNRIQQRLWLLSCLALIYPFSLSAQQTYLIDSTTVEVKAIKKNLFVPWEIVWGPDDHIWLSHDRGTISRLNVETGEMFEILKIAEMYPSNNQNDTRMTGLALAPDFENQPYVFTNYTYRGESYSSRNWDKYLRVVRYTYDAENDTLTDPLVLLENVQVFDGWHIGGKLVASKDQYLYIATGDAKQPESPSNHPDWRPWNPPKPLDLDEYLGKVLRIGFDGSVPQDNPLAEAPYEKTARNLVWTYGHRNMQGLVFTPNDSLYYAEHGPANDDEAGIIRKGFNYGWPEVEGFCDTDEEEDYCENNANLQAPLYTWTPPVAPSSMEFYTHEAIPEFSNSLLIATLTGTDREGEDIRVLTLNEAGDEISKEFILFPERDYLRIRDLCISPEGKIYFTSSNIVLNKGRTLGEDDIIFEISNPAFVSTSIDLLQNAALRFYPNPASSEITLPCQSCQGQRVRITDISGKTLLLETLQTAQLSLSALRGQQGIYLVFLEGKALGTLLLR